MLEHYLTTLLPFSANHELAKENLTKMVPKRLQRNLPLLHQLQFEGDLGTTLQELTESESTLSFNFDGEKLQNLAKYIVRGLVWHCWKVYIMPEFDIRAMCLPSDKALLITQEVSRLISAKSSAENLYNQTFLYQGFQGDYPELSVWRLAFYGGLTLGAPEWIQPMKTDYVVFTGRKEFLNSFEEKYSKS